MTDRKSTQPGEFVHSDVWEPSQESSIKGARYFVSFIDDASGYRQVYFMRNKSDVYECEYEKEYEKEIANKFGKTIKIFRSDNGREFCNSNMKSYLIFRGIRMENSAPNTPQQNGKAERENRTIIESARTMMKSKNMPNFLWTEAVNTAVYIYYIIAQLRNGTLRKLHMNSRLEENHRKNLSHLKIFGSTCYVHIPNLFRKKLDSKATKVILIDYDRDSSNYRVYDPQKKTVTIVKYVVFNEKYQDAVAEKEDLIDENMIILPGTSEDNSLGSLPRFLPRFPRKIET